MSKIVEVEKLTKIYGATKAVDNISFERSELWYSEMKTTNRRA